MSQDDAFAIDRFRKYLQIKTVQPKPDLEAAIDFLKKYGSDIGLTAATYELVPGYPVLILTWLGSDTSLKSVLLNSHMDVVPVFPESWTYDPFEAKLQDDGWIFGRGTQDMKCLAIMFLEAIRRLKARGFQPKRTVYLSFGPDEEVGGLKGMGPFVDSPEFEVMNVGVALDEGLASDTPWCPVYFAERQQLWMKYTFHGNPGHGSRFIKDTAMSRLLKFMNLVQEFRDQQEKKLESDPELTVGYVTSVNMNILEGGLEVNVVPSKMSVTVDIRVTPSETLDEMRSKLKSWILKALEKPGEPTPSLDEAVTMETVCAFSGDFTSPTDEDNPWWKALSGALSESGVEFKKDIFTGGTDIRYVRRKGIPSYGFTPMPNTPVLLHDHDERIHKDVFLKGIKIYENIIQRITSVEGTP
ncbi:unnamed protein product [Cyprideis torosa]|uniref:N-acyl-aliphatic-L-amino acid amidohydrolase n=1 Tax=Cyprideis torosa TaxID=163714 RepID=A0A7R8ZKU4_9CRUS|nr:unnamed protein product [Cyprideis torosa]CAG0880961.1 unnamed protein product [Cyprideis torosa]